MDDVNLLCRSVPEAQILLDRFSIALEWAGMVFRPDKSRSVVIVRGRCLHISPFSTSSGQVIPSLHDMPVRFLGRVIDGFLSDRKAVDELE